MANSPQHPCSCRSSGKILCRAPHYRTCDRLKMNPKTTVFIGFGANLGDRWATWHKTLQMLQKEPGVIAARAANPVETDPVGPIQNQPRFLNAVIALETDLAPLDLLDRLLGIEQQLGRVRQERWGPRTVDLDILLYGDETINHPRLQVPHPELKNRPFFEKLIKELLLPPQVGEGGDEGTALLPSPLP